jgi:hypothetical protein
MNWQEEANPSETSKAESPSWAAFPSVGSRPGTAIPRQELTSRGVPTGIERQKRFGRFLSWLLETVRLRNAHELGVGARAEN